MHASCSFELKSDPMQMGHTCFASWMFGLMWTEQLQFRVAPVPAVVVLVSDGWKSIHFSERTHPYLRR